jgi:glutamine amidotransferase
MIRILDYGVGNLRAILNIYKHLGIPASLAKNASQLIDADKLILPGVGSFDQAMKLLEASGMRSMLEDLVIKRTVPILGICVGMQMLAESSEEGARSGLGWISGKVLKLKPIKIEDNLLLPHMGWNEVEIIRDSPLFRYIEPINHFYFLHSFYFKCSNTDNEIGLTEYGNKFASAISNSNIYGVQFHPEKSHQFGIDLLRGFSEI